MSNAMKILFCGMLLVLFSGCDVLVAESISWSDSASNTGICEGEVGTICTLDLPAGGSDSASGTVWGTDIYTDDSSIGKAAVHAGEITYSLGGVVTIEIVAGQDSYEGTTRNGVTTEDYGSWPRSFIFID